MTPSHLKVREVPGGAPPAVAKVLQSGNYYDVLGVPRDSEDADIRYTMRRCLLEVLLFMLWLARRRARAQAKPELKGGKSEDRHFPCNTTASASMCLCLAVQAG